MSGGARIQQAANERHNILMIIGDDLGVDRVAAYGYRNAAGQLIAPATPHLDKLAKSGVLFRNAWAAPLCSPSRAMALTGKYPRHTGVGRFIPNDDSSVLGLNPDMLCMPDVLPEPYVSAIIGKWHLATAINQGRAKSTAHHPASCGFDLFRGTPGNLQTKFQSYFQFDWVEARLEKPALPLVTRVTDSYVTTHTTDEALKTIGEFGERPWLIWVAYHAPHRPVHQPPADLVHSQGVDASTKVGQGKAMIEALDSEIGRLLAGIDGETMGRTTVIFFGDNGTQRDLIEPPFDEERGKGTVYSNGVQVPMIVAGGLLPETSRGAESFALVDLTDLLPTVCDLLGVERPNRIDGRSFVSALVAPEGPSARKWIYGERFEPNFDPTDGVPFADRKFDLLLQTVREERYKLVVHHDPQEKFGARDVLQLYDLETDPHEHRNLLDVEGQPPAEAREAFERLNERMRLIALGRD